MGATVSWHALRRRNIEALVGAKTINSTVVAILPRVNELKDLNDEAHWQREMSFACLFAGLTGCSMLLIEVVRLIVNCYIRGREPCCYAPMQPEAPLLEADTEDVEGTRKGPTGERATLGATPRSSIGSEAQEVGTDTVDSEKNKRTEKRTAKDSP
mmetsp:Transcript_105649/g.294140  ORF Transcript_105649/g.294140 Transcript_105649/m.294140 type:complete len:156 (-) Transcript_105649:148-615(-)